MPPALSDLFNRNPVSTSIVGSGTSILATAVGGWIEQANAVLSLASTCIGLFAGLMTVCLAWDRWIRWVRRKRRQRGE